MSDGEWIYGKAEWALPLTVENAADRIAELRAELEMSEESHLIYEHAVRGLAAQLTAALRRGRELKRKLAKLSGPNWSDMVQSCSKEDATAMQVGAAYQPGDPKPSEGEDPATLSRWIPVGERLPEKWHRVIAFTEAHAQVVARIGVDDQWEESWDGNKLNRKITHWRELPAGPEVGDV